MTLKEEWEENQEDGAWVRAHRHQLMDETGVRIPRAKAAVKRWVNSEENREEVTEGFNDDSPESEDDSTEVNF